MVSRVDVHMYSLASAIKDPSTTSMSCMEAPFQAQNRSSRSEKMPYIQASPVSGLVSQWTSQETVPKYTQITKLLGMA